MMLVGLLSAALAAPVTPDEVVTAALSRDPALVEAETAVLTAEGELRDARGLRHNPTLEGRLGFGLPQHELALSQPLSVSGEGLAAARAAEAELRAAEARRDRRRLEVAAEARRALISAIAAGAEIERSQEVLRLATELRSAAEARLAIGAAPELEVHLARLEEAAAAADRVRARQGVLLARERLAATTGTGTDAELPADPMAAAPSDGAAGERADRVAALARIEGAEAALRRERAGVLPPVEVGVWAQVQNVSPTPGPDGVEVAPWSWSENAAWTVGPSLSATLPLWQHNRSGVTRAAGERDLAGAELASVEARIAAELAGSDERRAAMAAVGVTADPTPEARAALDGVDAAMAAGEMGAADAAVLRARILDAWRRGATARAAAAEIAVDLALAESWSGLLPGAP